MKGPKFIPVLLLGFVFISWSLPLSPARENDDRRAREALQRLDQIISAARYNNAASPQMITDLELVASDLKGSLIGGYGTESGGYYGGNGSGYDNDHNNGGSNWGGEEHRRHDRHGDNDNARDLSIPSRSDWKITGNLNNLKYLKDKNRTSRADSGTPKYRGYQINVDLKKTCQIQKVIQDHGLSQEDYPLKYTVEVSADGRQYFQVFSGNGSQGSSTAAFAPALARHIRITATAERGKGTFWSIHELGVE